MAEPHRPDPLPPAASVELRDAFCAQYRRLLQMVDETMERATDSVVLARLGDTLDEFVGLVNEVSLAGRFTAEGSNQPCVSIASQRFRGQ